MLRFIAAPTPRKVPAAHTGGSQVPGLITLHSAVSPTRAGAAAGVARFFASEKLPTSAHYVIDEAEVIQCVDDHTVAFHCGYNQDSLAFEMCDMPVLDSQAHWWLPAGKRAGAAPIIHGKRRRPLRWLEPQHRAMLRRTADVVAQAGLHYGIPLRYLTDDQLRAWDAAGRPAHLGGIVTHAQMSRVFKRSTHWDPGAWPRGLFLRRVRKAAAKLQGNS